MRARLLFVSFVFVLSGLATFPVGADQAASADLEGSEIGALDTHDGVVLRSATSDLAPDCGHAASINAGGSGAAVVPPWESCTGRIRPGAQMTAPVGCTFNFVFTDGSDRYIGTAGHCVTVGQRVAANGVGQFGTVVYQVLQGDDDFALIRIDSNKDHLVDPTVCTWGGPTSVAASRSILDEGPLLEYGWGIATFPHSTTRSRIHDEFLSGPNVVRWNGVGSGGDSGAPILTADGAAAGIHTRGLTPVVGVAWESGPTVTRILQLTTTAGYGLQLETAAMRWDNPL